MREVFTMWNNTRMIVLTALTAGVYGAVLGPFKIAVLIPGITEIRPGAVVPAVFGLLFGPAGAWGAGIGNVIGDFFGTLGPGSFFGFFGNFFYAFCVYKIWDNLFNGYQYRWSESKNMKWRYVIISTCTYVVSAVLFNFFYVKEIIPLSRSLFILINCAGFLAYVFVVIGLWGYVGYFFITVIVASCACSFIISWGIELLRLYPFAFLAPIIALNNILMASILGPLLLAIIYSRVDSWGLLWKDILDRAHQPRTLRGRAGAILIVCAIMGGIILGILISAGVYDFKPFQFTEGTKGNLVVLTLMPFLLLFIIGTVLE